MHCEITIDPNLLKNLTHYLTPFVFKNRQVVLISDEKVFSLSIKQEIASLTPHLFVKTLPISESIKNLTSAENLYTYLQANQIRKDALLIAIGGGTTGDLVGFVASTYLRGIDLIHIPTTLLAMCDSSIGGKNGLNTPYGKNMIGTITHPKAVLIDPHFLKTLPKRELCSGMAEVIKIAAVLDAPFFHYLELNMAPILALQEEKITTVIQRASTLKAHLIKDDSKRVLLNFGHTLGHAIEAFERYQNILHGEAISLGMSFSADLSLSRSLISSSDNQRLKNLLSLANLPIDYEPYLQKDIKKFIFSDKKNETDYLNFVVLREIGASELLKLQKECLLDEMNLPTLYTG